MPKKRATRDSHDDNPGPVEGGHPATEQPPPADGDTVVDTHALDRAASAFSGGRDVIEEVVTLYLEEAPALMARIHAGARGDPAELEFAAHALKSASGTVGAAGLHRLCAALEDMGREGALAGAQERAAAAGRELKRVQEALEAWLAAGP